MSGPEVEETEERRTARTTTIRLYNRSVMGKRFPTFSPELSLPLRGQESIP